MDIKAEELLAKLQQHKPLPQAQVLLLCGEEDYYRNSIIAALPEYVFGDTPEADREITVFDKQTDLAELMAAINTYPFFCGKSLVVLNDENLWAVRKKKNDNVSVDNEEANEESVSQQDEELDTKKIERLTTILTDVPDYCTVVLNGKKFDKRTKLYKALKQKAIICECNRIKEKQLPDWLNAQANTYGARLTYDAIEVIVDIFESVMEDLPLGVLKQEIDKLAIYTAGRKQWTAQDVLNVVVAPGNTSAFAITNFVADAKLKEALEVMAIEKKRGINILPLCARIQFKLRQLLRYHELKSRGYDNNSMMKELGLSSGAMSYVVKQSRHFNEKKLRQAIIAINDININIRRGGRDYGALEEVLIKLLQ